MGTNYYAVEKKYRLNRDVVHLGKSSAGWLFCIHETPEVHTFPQLKRWLKSNVDDGNYLILNEYDEELTTEQFLKIIEDKQRDKWCRDNPENFSYDCKNVGGYRFLDREFA